MRRARQHVWAGAALALALVSPAARADDDLTLDLGGATLGLKRIPKGTFTQGSSATEPGREKDEEPQRLVTISKDFFIGKTPVTRGQFARFVGDTRYVTEAEKGQAGGSGWDGKQLVQKKDFTWRTPGFTQTDEHPVVLVTYGDANAFAAWASRKTGKHVRLPTEAEWEYAARAGTTTPWYGGKTEEDALLTGWFRPNAGNGTRPVGQRKPNAFGLFDMSGNVFEWCRDVYAPYGPNPARDPEVVTVAGADPERRVLRGGSWLRDPKRGRSAARYRNTPGSRNADNGFRVVVVEDDAIGPSLGAGLGEIPPANALPLAASGSTAASSAPAPSVAPQGAPAQAAAEPFSWSLVAAPLAAAAAVVAWMLGRRRARTTTSTSASGIATRAVEDGFWVRVPDVAPGSRIRYACSVNGTTVTDVVPVEGGVETFVYTGSPPTAIEIVEVVAGARLGYRTPERPKTPATPEVVRKPVASKPPPVPKRPSSAAMPVAPPAPSSPPPPTSSTLAAAALLRENMSLPADASPSETIPAPTPTGPPVPPPASSRPLAPRPPSSRPAPPSKPPPPPSSPTGPPAPSPPIIPDPVFLGFPRAY
jgi:formylglycine-generating enzyme required for sulfatase activity